MKCTTASALVAFAAIMLPPMVTAIPTVKLAARDESTLAYDTIYDDASGSMDSVACSDGENGLAPKYPTFGDLPTYPNVGGTPSITGWNDESCGSCWQLQWNDKSVYFTGIDVGGDSFVGPKTALDDLTDGRAEELGRVDVTATQVDGSNCGL